MRYHRGAQPGKARKAMRFTMITAAFMVAIIGVASSPAMAHTRLVEATPANRSITAESPEHLTLVFAEAVDPRTVHLDILTVDGRYLPGSALLTPLGADAETITYDLPQLADGVYGLVWVTVGPDGHRVAGEVVIGIGTLSAGAVDEPNFDTTQGLDSVLGVISGIGRFVWYLGIALFAGSLLLRWWTMRPSGRTTGASEALSTVARRGIWVGPLTLHIGLILRSAASITLVTRGYRTGSVAEDLRLAIIDGMGLTLVLAVAGSVALLLWAPRMYREQSGLALIQGGLALLGVIALGSATSHTAILSDDPFGIWISTLHLAAAGAWVGPLIVLAWAARTARWRNEPAERRQQALNVVFRRFTPVAAIGLVVLLATGIRSTWLLAGREIITNTSYTVTLAIKLSLLALIVIPLALYHNTQTGWLARFRCPCRGDGHVSTSSARNEAAALVAVLAVAAVLAGLNPAIIAGQEGTSAEPAVATQDGPAPVPVEATSGAPAGNAPLVASRGRGLGLPTPGSLAPPAPQIAVPPPNPIPDSSDAQQTAAEGTTTTDNASARTSPLSPLLDDTPPTDVAECARLTVGKPNCYRSYFASVMRSVDASAAVAEIVGLSEVDDYISIDCHQIVHDLGNDAAEWYGDIGIALSYEGSPCWSGYYHGVVEYAISQFSETLLYDEIAYICTAAAEVQYSFTHYNCVHGLGHGVMLNLDGDLFASIPYCEALLDIWEAESCVGGALMENIIEAQQGIATAVRTDDLVYPCNVIAEVYVDDCFAMQTSWMLYRLGYELGDYQADEIFIAAFAICDTVREDMIDQCYRSMGRDISGSSQLDVGWVLWRCSLGDDTRQAECIVGASLNAVFERHDTLLATALCDAAAGPLQESCYSARDYAASTF